LRVESVHMVIERCEGCPIIKSGSKCSGVRNLLQAAREVFSTPEGNCKNISTGTEIVVQTAQTIGYVVECPLLLDYVKRTTPKRKSNGPTDDLRGSDHESECATRSTISIEIDGDQVIAAFVQNWKIGMGSLIAEVLGRRWQ
jgi:hypothetical protein